jgi:hypothetical protein
MQTLNVNYAIEEEDQGSRYPALQAETYKPVSLKQPIRIGLSQESVELLGGDALKALKCETVPAIYKGGDVEVDISVPTATLRWVIVGRPQIFLFDKDQEKYEHWPRGLKLAGTKKVTASRVLMACLCDGEILTDEAGLPQAFTLNLKSSKTQLVGGYNSKPGDGSIASLNKGLCDHWKQKGWLTHLVSVALKAVPEKFTQRNGDQSSLGVRFVLDGNASVLSEADQKTMFEFSQLSEIVEAVRNPFRLETVKPYREMPLADPIYEDDSFDS